MPRRRRVCSVPLFSDVALSDDLYEDYRPFARSVLASLGPHAKRYAAQAFAVMGSADPLRTGAAQIAVAGRHPGALDAVERLMSRRLARVPVGAVVPWDDEMRLDELGYALAFGGPEARAHVGALRAFMTRKVQSWAPPFGMIEGVPRAMCEVLSRITGVEEAALGYPYCGRR